MKNYYLILFTISAIGVFASSAISAGPQLKWVYVSSGITVDRWESDGLRWNEKQEFPKILRSINIGAQWNVGGSHSLFFSLPAFYNSTESFWSNEEKVLKTSSGKQSLGYMYFKRPVISAFGVGDIQVEYTWYAPFARLELALWAPTGYDPDRKVFYSPESVRPNAGYEYNAPWTGFGVWRVGPGISAGNGMHYGWAQTSLVVYKPQGDRPGQVEEWDFSVSGGYSFSAPLSRMWKLKPKADAGYSSYHWEGRNRPRRVDFSVTPGAALSFTPTWQHELSFSVGATAYARSVEHAEDIDSPRKLNFGVYYGYYR